MHRRHWLKSSAATALATLSPPLRTLLAENPKPLNILYAVKYQMIRDGQTPLEKFHILEKAGLDGTEVTTSHKLDHNAVRDASRETKLPVHGIINSSNPEIIPALELAKFYDATSVLVVAGDDDDSLSYDQKFAHWQKLIHKALPLAEKTDIKIAIENVRNTFLKEAEEMARFIDSFQSPAVRSYFDTGNTITWTEQSAAHWAKVLGHRIYKLDIKDRGHPQFGDPKLKRPGVTTGTDDGEVNWQSIRQTLRQLNFSGWATAEIKGGNLPHLKATAQWMRSILNPDRSGNHRANQVRIPVANSSLTE
ncbi:MAG: sugar phosphate isomerase/epimerase family protein [Verrucomicrobiota bacterium]